MCPFVDKRDQRCAGHLSLENISSAFAHCADQYEQCPVYGQLLSEIGAHAAIELPVRVAAGG